MAFEDMFSAMPDIIAVMPALIYGTQVIFYIVFIWMCGSLAMLGWKKHTSFMPRTGLTLLTGLLCIFASASFAGFVPFFSTGVMHIFFVDAMIAGILVAAVLSAALLLITHGLVVPRPDDIAETLKKKVAVLEEKLRSKANQIQADDAKKIAEREMPGYAATSAKLIGDEWEVGLLKGDNAGKVVIDAWDGSVKQKMKKFDAVEFFSDVHRIIGFGVLIAVLVASVVFFEGFPNPSESFYSLFGITPDDMAGMSDSLRGNPFVAGNLPEGCIAPFFFTEYDAQFQDDQFLLDHLYENDSVKAMVEEKSADSVRMMIGIEHEGRGIVVAFTESKKSCYLTDGKFCACMEGRQ